MVRAVIETVREIFMGYSLNMSKNQLPISSPPRDALSPSAAQVPQADLDVTPHFSLTSTFRESGLSDFTSSALPPLHFLNHCSHLASVTFCLHYSLSPCLRTHHLQFILHSASRAIFLKCQNDHMNPLLNVIQLLLVNSIKIIQSLLTQG